MFLMLKIFFLHVHDKGKKNKKYTFKTSLQYLLVSREKKIIGYKNVKSYKDRANYFSPMNSRENQK
jgi:hypothetical protein